MDATRNDEAIIDKLSAPEKDDCTGDPRHFSP
jgi:hypothetical protein